MVGREEGGARLQQAVPEGPGGAVSGLSGGVHEALAAAAAAAGAGKAVACAALLAPAAYMYSTAPLRPPPAPFPPPGKSGQGKSSTLNSLLGEKAASVAAFKMQPDTESTTTYARQVRSGVGGGWGVDGAGGGGVNGCWGGMGGVHGGCGGAVVWEGHPWPSHHAMPCHAMGGGGGEWCGWGQVEHLELRSTSDSGSDIVYHAMVCVPSSASLHLPLTSS
jgi:hypothetical protein